MPRKYLYLALFVIGAVVPYLSFVPWLMDHGFDISRMVEELFANRISAFFGLDVVISALALFVFVSFEGRRAGVKHTWAPVVATLTIGVSAGLPLFLFLRESAIAPSTRL
jgi:predicted exporter